MSEHPAPNDSEPSAAPSLVQPAASADIEVQKKDLEVATQALQKSQAVLTQEGNRIQKLIFFSGAASILINAGLLI